MTAMNVLCSLAITLHFPDLVVGPDLEAVQGTGSGTEEVESQSLLHLVEVAKAIEKGIVLLCHIIASL